MCCTYEKIDRRFTYRGTKNSEPAISTKPSSPPIMQTRSILPSSDSSIPATKAGRRQRQACGVFSRAPPHRVPSMYNLLIYGGRREIAAVGRRASTQVAGTCAVTCVFYIRGLHVPSFTTPYVLLLVHLPKYSICYERGTVSVLFILEHRKRPNRTFVFLKFETAKKGPYRIS